MKQSWSEVEFLEWGEVGVERKTPDNGYFFLEVHPYSHQWTSVRFSGTLPTNAQLAYLQKFLFLLTH